MTTNAANELDWTGPERERMELRRTQCQMDIGGYTYFRLPGTKPEYAPMELPKTAAEAVARQKAPYIKWPKLMYWKDLKADVRGFNWAQHETDNRQWPDQTEEWDEEVEEAIEEGHATSEVEALRYLYANNEDFKDEMDALWANELEYCKEQDRKRRMALWHRAAWAAVWCRRLRGPEQRVRWTDPADRELPCPKCKGVAAAQAANARGKRRANCCDCGYAFKLAKAARTE